MTTSTTYQAATMDEIKEAQCRSTVRSAKQEAIDYMVSRIKYTIGVLKCDSLVPRLVLEGKVLWLARPLGSQTKTLTVFMLAVTKNYTQKSLGQLARVRFESWDEESGDVDDMEEDEPMDDSSDIQGDDDVSDEADEIQAEDGGELSPETMTLIVSYYHHNKNSFFKLHECD